MRKTTLRNEVDDALSLSELCHFCHVDEAWVVQLVDHGVLDPAGTSRETWTFHGVNIVRAKKAQHLHLDLGINPTGIAMLLDLLEERETLVRKLAMYQDA